MSRRIAILGAGNGGLTMAADLTLAGFEVKLFEMPQFKDSLRPILEAGGIEIEGKARNGFAKVSLASTDAARVLKGADTVFVVAPSYAHAAIVEHAAPYLEEGQVLVLAPAYTGGSVEAYNVLKRFGVHRSVTVAETSTLPYACRRVGPAKVQAFLRVKKFFFAAFPGRATSAALEKVREIYPNAEPVETVLETSLNNGNPVVHVAPAILNAGRIEYAKGEYYHYQEGITPSVARVVEKVDQERLDLCRALGITAMSTSERVVLYGYAPPRPTLYEQIHASDAFVAKGPSDLKTRYITEDIPYGLVTWASLGDSLGVETTIMDALVDLGSYLLGVDYWKEGRTLERLGVPSGGAERIKEFFVEGPGGESTI